MLIDEEKHEEGVTESNYASMLSDAINKKDAQIAEMKKQHEATVKDLTNQILNGGNGEEGKPEQEVVLNREQALEKFQSGVDKGCSNLEYWENLIELRKATIRETGKDPCLTGQFSTGPEGRVEPAYGEAEELDKTFDTIEETIKECNGDKELFRVKFASLFR